MLKRLLWIVLMCWSGLAAAQHTILVYGDSLSAAYGISQRQGWVALLQERLQARNLDYTVVNASISGETSSGGAARIDEVLSRTKPDIVVLALGANDGLRGLPVAQMKRNLSRIIEASQQAGARVLVAGMRLPPNYGQRYAQEFEQAFAELAKRHKTAYLPFLLEGMATQQALFQPDQLHPTAEAQPIILDTVWQALEPLLQRRTQRTDRRGSPAAS
ncbi:MAG: arylesterase [Pseudomonadota bacterium]